MNFAKLDANDYRPATALGGFTNGVSALEMASGYAAIENDGNYRAPTCIVKILDADGNEIYAPAQTEEAVYKQNAARMMTDVLKRCYHERNSTRTWSWQYACSRKDRYIQRPEGRMVCGIYEILHDECLGWL